MSEWLIPVSILIVALAFVVLVIFLVITLMNLTRSLKRTERLLEESNEIVVNVNQKLHAFDPIFNQFSRVTQKVEKKSEDICELSEELKDECCECGTRRDRAQIAAVGLEFVELGLIGWSLINKLRKRR